MLHSKLVLPREAIKQVYLSAEAGQGRKLVYHRFRRLFSAQSLQRVLDKYEKTEIWEKAKSSGRPPSVNTIKNRKAVDKLMTNHGDTSSRIVASKLNISQSSVVRIVKSIPDLKARKKKKAPYYRQGQAEIVQKQCRKLRRYFIKLSTIDHVIIDDEKFFDLDSSDVAGQEWYYAKNPEDIPPSQKLRHK